METKVRFFKDTDGWWYEVTGFEPPHEGTTHFTGPFIFKFLARLHFKWRFIQ